MEHALDHPPGLRGIVVADSPASMTLWVSEANRLRRGPAGGRAGDADAARGGRHDGRPGVRGGRPRLLRPPPLPGVPMAGLRRSGASRRSTADPTVYHTMNGPSEFHVHRLADRTGTSPTGSHEITTPTLLVSGRYDEATPLIVGQIHERIPGARVGDLRGVEPHAARRGARGVPRDGGGVPAHDRLTAATLQTLVEAAAAIRMVESEHDLLVCASQRADRVDCAERDDGRLLARQRQAVQQFVEFLAVSGIELGVDSQRPKRARVVPRP